MSVAKEKRVKKSPEELKQIFKVRKLPNKDLYRVTRTDTKEVHAKGTTWKLAQAQVHLLRNRAEKTGLRVKTAAPTKNKTTLKRSKSVPKRTTKPKPKTVQKQPTKTIKKEAPRKARVTHKK